MCQRLNIRTPHVEQAGRRAQRRQPAKESCIAKWLARVCRLLILDEPTRGIDVGAKRRDLRPDARAGRQQNIGVLMISSDLEEILGVSDRVLVMHQGDLAGGLTRAEMTEQAIMRLATGGEAHE